MLAVEEAIATTHGGFAKTYGYLLDGWEAFACDFEQNRKRRRLDMGTLASHGDWLARSLLMDQIDDIGGLMWQNMSRSVKELKVSAMP